MIDMDTLNWSKCDGLMPAIVQDASNGAVLMLGYMDQAALSKTVSDRLVTFYSRSRQAQWQKGETSGNVLKLVNIITDCDSDALLVLADPVGPTCHLGMSSCFGNDAGPAIGFIETLAKVIERQVAARPRGSYTARLVECGMQRVAQKVGEEAFETVLAATSHDVKALTSEAADLVYHLSVLLNVGGSSWADVSTELMRRHQARTSTAAS